MGFPGCAASRLQDFDKFAGLRLLCHSSCSAQLLCFRRPPKFSSLTGCSRANTIGFIVRLRMRFCTGKAVAIQRRVTSVTPVPPIAGLALALIEREASAASSRLPEQPAADLLRLLRARRVPPV